MRLKLLGSIELRLFFISSEPQLNFVLWALRKDNLSLNVHGKLVGKT